VRQVVAISDGLTSEQAKEVVRYLKEAKMKEGADVDQRRDRAHFRPDKDGCRTVIAFLKEHDFGVELKFGNYRSN
jgi:uncharacterized protein YajQ (UPF0234 family)